MKRSATGSGPYQFRRLLGPAASPLEAYETLYGPDRFGFLYESLETSGERGRYSFLGGRPRQIVRSQGRHVTIESRTGRRHARGNPFTLLRALLDKAGPHPRLKPFPGGWVGYAGYDAVRWFEDVPANSADELEVPDVFFMMPDEIVVYDHAEQTCGIVLYHQDRRRLAEIVSVIAAGRVTHPMPIQSRIGPLSSNCTQAAFGRMVERAKHYIYAGDIFQVVLSQRFSCRIQSPALAVYRACRITNPSPYMYYLNLNGLHIIGSSPEILVRLTRGEVGIRPLAGTRPRGRDAAEDKRLEQELRGDAKERAEHVMLVDLARNDIGRVCDYGSVRPLSLMDVEKYSRVMHIVSDVRGRLSPGRDAFDLFGATFPAGTVSGAPKIRAMEIIDGLEPCRRSIYAGAIGYVGLDGNMDMCIAIRNIIIKEGRAYIQAGAGIVCDSNPLREYEETMNKARALFSAIELGGSGWL